MEKNAADDAAYRAWLDDHGMEDPGYFGEDPVSECLNRNSWRELPGLLSGLEERYKSVYSFVSVLSLGDQAASGE